MGRGRRKAVAKKMVREVKYFSPKVDYAGLAEEIGTEQFGHNAEDFVGDAIVVEGDALEKPLHEMNEDELQEYLEWSKNAASKPHGSKLEHVK